MAVKAFAKVDQSVIPNVNCTWCTTCDIFSVFATHRLDLQSKKLLLSKQYTFSFTHNCQLYVKSFLCDFVRD